MVAWNWFQLRHAIGGVVPKPLSIAVHNGASEQSAATDTSFRVIWSKQASKQVPLEIQNNQASTCLQAAGNCMLQACVHIPRSVGVKSSADLPSPQELLAPPTGRHRTVFVLNFGTHEVSKRRNPHSRTLTQVLLLNLGHINLSQI
jgi:hypothetical protein